MTNLRTTGPVRAIEDVAPSAPGTRQPAHHSPSTNTPSVSRTVQRGRSRYIGLQWMLAVGSIAAVVVGANGLALQDAATVTVAPARVQIIMVPGLPELSVLDLPPILTLPSWPVARSRSSR